VYKFPNGYGASVVAGSYFYTDTDNPYELAVVKFDADGEGFEIDYTTPITDDVMGYLNERKLDAILQQIKDLPTKESTDGN